MSSAQLIETVSKVLLTHPERTAWLSTRISHWKYLWGPHMLLLHTLPMLNIVLVLQCSLWMTASHPDEWLHYGTARSGTRTLVWLLQRAAYQQKDEHMSYPCQQVTCACMQVLWGWCLDENGGASSIGLNMFVITGLSTSWLLDKLIVEAIPFHYILPLAQNVEPLLVRLVCSDQFSMSGKHIFVAAPTGLNSGHHRGY